MRGKTLQQAEQIVFLLAQGKRVLLYRHAPAQAEVVKNMVGGILAHNSMDPGLLENLEVRP